MQGSLILVPWLPLLRRLPKLRTPSFGPLAIITGIGTGHSASSRVQQVLLTGICMARSSFFWLAEELFHRQIFLLSSLLLKELLCNESIWIFSSSSVDVTDVADPLALSDTRRGVVALQMWRVLKYRRSESVIALPIVVYNFFVSQNSKDEFQFSCLRSSQSKP